MSSYCSTWNDCDERLSFQDLLFGCSSLGAGLKVPLVFFRLSKAELLLGRFLSYQSLAFRVTRHFINDLSYPEIRKLLRGSYNKMAFKSFARTPLIFGPVSLKQVVLGKNLFFVAELSCGLSASFKDVAMRAMGMFFGRSLKQQLSFISATSGDTGSSACFALVGNRSCRITVLSPNSGLTTTQEEQMYGTIGRGVMNVRLSGKFDCCQNMLKGVLGTTSNSIGTMNSISWARIMFQLVYYFVIYFWTTATRRDSVVVSVPSGNFGNSYACFVSKLIGLPIKMIVVSTNENNVLEEFFRAGEYAVRSSNNTQRTDSPSMDITKASNLERLAHEVLNRNCRLLADAFYQIKDQKILKLLRFVSCRSLRLLGVSGHSAYRHERAHLVKFLFERSGVIVDTHTANGIKVLLAQRVNRHPVIILETAQPHKTKELLASVAIRCYRLGTFRTAKYSRVMTNISSHLVRIIRC